MSTTEAPNPIVVQAEIYNLFRRQFGKEDLVELVKSYGLDAVVSACASTSFPYENQKIAGDQPGDQEDHQYDLARRKQLNQWLNEMSATGLSGDERTEAQAGAVPEKLESEVEILVRHILSQGTSDTWIGTPFSDLIEQYDLVAVKTAAYAQLPEFTDGDDMEGGEGENIRVQNEVLEHVHTKIALWFSDPV